MLYSMGIFSTTSHHSPFSQDTTLIDTFWWPNIKNNYLQWALSYSWPTLVSHHSPANLLNTIEPYKTIPWCESRGSSACVEICHLPTSHLDAQKHQVHLPHVTLTWCHVIITTTFHAMSLPHFTHKGPLGPLKSQKIPTMCLFLTHHCHLSSSRWAISCICHWNLAFHVMLACHSTTHYMFMLSSQ